MRWRRLIFGLIGLVLLVVIAIGGALLWVIRTDSGTGWLMRRVAAMAGPSIDIGVVSGTLRDGISVSRVRIALGEAELEIDDLRVSASLSELVARHLVIYELAASDVRYSLESPSASNSAGRTFELSLPVSIELRQVTVGSVEVMTPGVELTFAGTSLAGSFEGSSLRLQDFRTSTAGVSVRADASVELGDMPSQSTEFSWSTEIDGIAWSGSGRTSGWFDVLRFEHRLDAPFIVTASGELRLSDTPAARVSLAWQELAWPGFELARSPSGSAELSGWLDRVEFTGSGQAVVRDTRLGFMAAGSATPEQVSVTELAIDTELGSGDIVGDFEIGSMSFDVDVDARGIDPSRFVEGWPGELAAKGRLFGSLEPELSWSATGLEIGGTLRDRSIAGSGAVVSNRAGEWQLDTVEVDWGGNRLEVSGRVGAALDLAVNVDAPSLAAFRPGLEGHLTLGGELGGSIERPAFVGTAGIDRLALGNLGVEQLRLEGRVSALREAEVALRFAASGISAARPIVETITGTIEGTTAAHAIEVDIRPVIGSGTLSAVGSFDGAEWTGEIRSAVLDQELLGSWSLERPTTLAASARSFVLREACLRKAASDLCLGARVGTGDDVLDLTVDGFDVAWLQPLIAEPVTVAGLYDAAVHLRGPLTRPTGTVSVRGDSSRISVSDAEAPIDIPIDDVAIDAELTESRLDGSASFRTAADTSVSIEGALTEIWTPAPQVDAIIEGIWADVGFLSLLSPDVGRVSGLATASITVSGPLEAPEVEGEANWRDGEVAVPQWGVVVEDIDVRVTSRTGRELDYEVSARAGDGTISLTGETLLDPQARWPTTFNVHGENLAAVQLPEAQVTVSPDLQVFTAWPEINVTGTVAVPTASLNLEDLPAQSATTSPDVVVHGATARAPQRPLDIFANIELVLGDDVRFRGSGLSAQLEGRLDLDYRSGRPPVARGNLSLAGDYTTFGQMLELDRGQLLFSGALTDPTLDVRGVKRFETTSGGVTVGVLVTGTVRAPVTRLYSDPSMSDGDIISYLVVGRPVSDSSRENSEALQTAALSMGITQALPQIQHLGETVGLDELGIRTSEANTGELMAGKQISSKLYVRYTYGLINRVGGLLMRFRLTDHLSLETRTGDATAMDLLYTVERE